MSNSRAINLDDESLHLGANDCLQAVRHCRVVLLSRNEEPEEFWMIGGEPLFESASHTKSIGTASSTLERGGGCGSQRI